MKSKILARQIEERQLPIYLQTRKRPKRGRPTLENRLKKERVVDALNECYEILDVLLSEMKSYWGKSTRATIKMETIVNKINELSEEVDLFDNKEMNLLETTINGKTLDEICIEAGFHPSNWNKK